MIRGIGKSLVLHYRENQKNYIILLIVLLGGIIAGYFAVNGLNLIQREELTNFLMGFFRLFDTQSVNSPEIFKYAILQNLKFIGLIWFLGLTVIGIPFIYLTVGFRGLVTGFTAGFLIKILGIKGALVVLFTLLPKELILIPCIVSLGARGINFSLSILKSKSIRTGLHESFRYMFFSYCLSTLFYVCVTAVACVWDAWISPVFVRIISGYIVK